MKKQFLKIATGFCLLLAIAACKKQTGVGAEDTPNQLPPPADVNTSNSLGGSSLTVGLGGNAFITANGGAELINSTGLHNWTSANAITSVYFRLGLTGNLTVALKATVPSGSSNIKVTVNGTAFNKTISGTAATTYTIGTVNITSAGYVKVDIQGVSKTGSYFGDVSDLIISGPAVASGVQYANDAANYYWSRRGPSVHLNYTVGSNTEWFYSEITVPTGEDKIGSYYMANGFNGGYFGMQVNSATQRKFLFSVWDPSTGQTTVTRTGTGVTAGRFGGEGDGGQSYLVFNWVAGNTYKFLTQGKPDGAGSTDYSSWVYTPESGTWRFLATWHRPNTNSYLSGMYSFLENFLDYNGYLGRKAQYGNQWYKTATGSWTEVTSASFSKDATGTNEQRMDYKGGVENGNFYLQNGGFFANYTSTPATFTRTATGTAPTVNLTTLP